MSTEQLSITDRQIQKTISFDRGIRDAATSVGAVSLAAICVAPIVLGPAALVSGVVFFVAEHQMKANQKELKNSTL